MPEKEWNVVEEEVINTKSQVSEFCKRGDSACVRKLKESFKE